MAHRLPLPRPHLSATGSISRSGEGGRSSTTPEARPTTTPGPGSPNPGCSVRRPVHLGVAQCRQPAEGPALPGRVGRRPPPDARPLRLPRWWARGPPSRPRLPGGGCRPVGRPWPTPPSSSSRWWTRPRPHEHRCPARRGHPHRRAPGPLMERPYSSPSTTSLIHRAHHLAPLRRLVGRQSGHAQAGSRAVAGQRAGRAGRGRRCWPTVPWPRGGGEPSRRRRENRPYPGPTSRTAAGRAPGRAGLAGCPRRPRSRESAAPCSPDGPTRPLRPWPTGCSRGPPGSGGPQGDRSPDPLDRPGHRLNWDLRPGRRRSTSNFSRAH